MDKLYVSGEGLERLKANLAECNQRRMKVANVIEQARGYGDLSVEYMNSGSVTARVTPCFPPPD